MIVHHRRMLAVCSRVGDALSLGPDGVGQGDDPVHAQAVAAGTQLDQPGTRNVGVHAGEQPSTGAVYGGVVGGITPEADQFIRAVMADILDAQMSLPPEHAE